MSSIAGIGVLAVIVIVGLFIIALIAAIIVAVVVLTKKRGQKQLRPHIDGGHSPQSGDPHGTGGRTAPPSVNPPSADPRR